MGSFAPKRKRPKEHEEMLEEVRNEKLNEQVLIEKLKTHVEQCDATGRIGARDGERRRQRAQAARALPRAVE